MGGLKTRYCMAENQIFMGMFQVFQEILVNTCAHDSCMRADAIVQKNNSFGELSISTILVYCFKFLQGGAGGAKKVRLYPSYEPLSLWLIEKYYFSLIPLSFVIFKEPCISGCSAHSASSSAIALLKVQTLGAFYNTCWQVYPH